ncbi:MAG: cytidine deaminase [Planctomycetes bacterium]|nr:cytidine deaminase [Planctomycetota bacterium]
MSPKELLALAIAARAHAYAPYSHYSVGAALLTRGGKVFTGCNVENASYGLGTCAERVALATAVAAGEREFEWIAVAVGGADKARPCGACRQVLSEFAPELRLVLGNGRGRSMVTRLSRLLPMAFSLREPPASRRKRRPASLKRRGR